MDSRCRIIRTLKKKKTYVFILSSFSEECFQVEAEVFRAKICFSPGRMVARNVANLYHRNEGGHRDRSIPSEFENWYIG